MIEVDIVNFVCFSGDYFYVYMDKIVAVEFIFGEWVVYGYFVFFVVVGLFVDVGVGLVIVNYGLESLCFIEFVKLGDIIQVCFICKCKMLKKQCSVEEKLIGVVEWVVEVFNQY